MKKMIRIKIIKHKDIPILSAVIQKAVDHEQATVCEKAGRELAGHVTDWVNEWREGRRVEEKRNIRHFFGEPDAMPNAA